jgi:hypothetical protein
MNTRDGITAAVAVVIAAAGWAYLASRPTRLSPGAPVPSSTSGFSIGSIRCG